jgi:hypothetical protein
MVATATEVLLDVTSTVNDVKSETNDHGVSFDTTVNITCIGLDNQSLDYDPAACIAACQDVSMGVHYDEQLIDCINSNWDDDLATTHDPDIWTTVSPHT